MPTDPPLPDVLASHRLSTLVGELSRAWRARLDPRLKPLGLSQASGVVLWALALGGALTQTQLARSIGIEGSTLVRQIDRLEADGHLRRVQNPDDRRANLLELTDSGSELANAVDAVGRAVRDELFAGLPVADLHTTMRTLHQLRMRLPD